jgi:hypothetical protein
MIDMFSLILMSLKYAERFHRTLIIDTRKSLHFQEGFHKYFICHHPQVCTEGVPLSFEGLSLYPVGLHLNYDEFNPFTDHYPTIDLNEAYAEDILLYGNDNRVLDKDILYFFKHFEIRPLIKDCLKERLEILPKPYIAVHIRNTDRSSDVNTFIEQHRSVLSNQSIFLATDDRNVLSTFQQEFSPVFHFTHFSDSTEKCYGEYRKGIHFLVRTEREHEQFNIDTMTDFLLLVNADQYYYSCSTSGFSVCAENLRSRV